MFWSIIIGILLVIYILWVIRRKVQQFREGKYCGGSCCDCGCTCSAGDKKEKSKIEKSKI